MRRNYSISTGIPLSYYKADLLKHAVYTTERREKAGILVCHILPLVHLLIPACVASTGQHVWYAQPGQVPKTASPPLFKARSASFVFHCYNHWLFSLSLRHSKDAKEYVEALTKFTQNALNGITEAYPHWTLKCLSWRKLSPKIGRPRVLSLPHKELPLSLCKWNLVCSYLMSLLMYHLY